MQRAASVCIATFLLSLASGCVDPEPDLLGDPTTVAVVTELTTRWNLFPHRLSHHEISFEQTDERRGRLAARLDGGAWGALDIPFAAAALEVWTSRALRAEPASVELEIPPGAEDAGERFAVAERVTIPAGSLAGVEAAVAFLRGYRITTDQYDEPPPFETDPDLPYDPAEGYTTQGLGIALGDVEISGGEASLEVRVRNSLGPSDRGDMNAAIDQASTWLRVDFVVVGVVAGGLLSGETGYFLSTAEYGQNTVHEHAPDDEQAIRFERAPGPASALFGLRAFDLWLNLDGRIDPSCVVVQDEINSWDEPISGPGRYVTVLSTRLWGAAYDAAAGTGTIHADLMLSNSSAGKEVGNICLGTRAVVGMLQLDDPEAEHVTVSPEELRLVSGEPGELEIEL